MQFLYPFKKPDLENPSENFPLVREARYGILPTPRLCDLLQDGYLPTFVVLYNHIKPSRKMKIEDPTVDDTGHIPSD